MKNIKTLIMKDLYEYKNNWRKFTLNIVFIIGIPIVIFNFWGVTTPIIKDVSVFSEVVGIIFTSLIYAETTMFQIHRDIQDGVYEKYYINLTLNKIEIFFAKFISNLVITYACLLLISLINYLLGFLIKNQLQFNINIKFIVILFFTCAIGTCVSYIISLVIHNDNNAGAYGAFVFAIYVGYYKILEWLKIDNWIIEISGLAILSIVLTFLVIYLLNQNRFIRRE